MNVAQAKRKQFIQMNIILRPMTLVLNIGHSWASIAEIFPGKKYHYKTIQDKFLQWSRWPYI